MSQDFVESVMKYYEDSFLKTNSVSAIYYQLLVELFGRDKIYFNLEQSNMRSTEEGIELVDGGLHRNFTRIDEDSVIHTSKKPSNKLEFLERDWLWDNCGIKRIMINCTTFDPDNPLDSNDFDYMPEDYHPNLMYGYCFALALYCTMFDEPCIEQNDGIMSTHDYEIPGDTPEEKEAYMVMIKNLVQEQLDFQNSK